MTRNNLPSKAANFTGRKVEMDALSSLLKRDSVVNITGEPGIGKSALAIALAHGLAEDETLFPAGAVWAGAGDEAQGSKIMGLDSLLGIIVRTVTGDSADGVDINQKMSAIHEILSDAPCLLVLDNMETVMEDAEIWGFIKNLPDGTKALLTGTEPVAIASNYTLDRLSSEDSVRMFIDTMPRKDKSADEAAVSQITERLGGWPLAIAVTAGQSAVRTLAELSEELRGDQSTGVWMRLQSAYETLSETERELFKQCAVLLVPAVREDFFRMFGPSIEPAIATLAERHLLESSGEKYSMHSLVKEFGREKIYESGLKASAYHKRAYDGYIEKDPIIASEHLYAYALEEEDDVTLKEFAAFVRKLVSVLDMKGQWDAALYKSKQGLEASRTLGLKNSEADFLNQMGMITFNKGDLEGAMDILDEALALTRDIENKQAESIVLGNIGNIRAEQGHADEALESHEQALTLSREIADKQGIANSLVSIGNLNLSQGSLDEALESFTQALSPLLEAEDRYGLASAFGNIGGIHNQKGNRKEALESLVKALKIFSDIGDKPGAAYSLFNIGMIFAEIGNLDESLMRLQQSLELYTQLDDQPEVRRLTRMIARIEEYKRENPVV